MADQSTLSCCLDIDATPAAAPALALLLELQLDEEEDEDEDAAAGTCTFRVELRSVGVRSALLLEWRGESYSCSWSRSLQDL